MSRTRIPIWLGLIVLAIGALIAFVVGLFAYMSATATPLHPDPKGVPSAGRSAPSAAWSAAVDQARQIVRANVSEQNLPGVSVAVGAGGDIVWAEGFGWTNLDSQARVTPDTRFRIGEVSMTLTSAAVGLLLERNKLSLDDEIQTYVPQYPKKPWPVTLRQLMGHVAGVMTDEGDEEPMLERCERTVDGLKRFADSSLRFEPGTQSRFSSYGWVLVSAAVEAAADERFFEFMRTQVFDPVGMAATVPDLMTAEIPDRATFYFPRFAGDTRYGPEPAREGDHSCSAGARGFLSTPSDLVRFGMAVSGGKLLQRTTVELLQTPVRLASGEQTDYGLGWKIETVPFAGSPTRLAGHGTKTDFIGGTASLLTFPERRLVVAVTSNTSFADTKTIALKVAEAFAATHR
jgi:serine beta-lactamase-like protein LACTB